MYHPAVLTQLSQKIIHIQSKNSVSEEDLKYLRETGGQSNPVQRRSLKMPARGN